MAEPTVRPMTAGDWPAVAAIWADGIATGNATFEEAPPDWPTFDSSRRAELRLVAEKEGRVVGWAAASGSSTRPAYRGVVEHSVYVSAAERGNGTGRMLLVAFLDLARAAGVWTVQSSIFPENAASLRVHESAGFRVVGVRQRIAQMTYGPYAGWRDTVLVEWRAPQEGQREN